jgi:hypothetical protein
MSMPISSTGSFSSVAAVTTKPTSANEKLETPAMEASESQSEKALELSTEGSKGTRINTTA